MSLSFFETQLEINESNVPEVNADAQVHLGLGLKIKAKSAGVEVVLERFGVNFRQETIKYESEDGSGKVAGPSAGAEAGYKRTEKGENIVLKTELSLARAEKSFQVTENVDAYVSANLNANTGFQAGDDGVEVNLVGFGLTLGVGGRWTINTPFGSFGGKKPDENEGSSSVPVSNEPPNRELVANF